MADTTNPLADLETPVSVNPLADLMVPAGATTSGPGDPATVNGGNPLADLEAPASSPPVAQSQVVYRKGGQLFNIPAEQAEAARWQGYEAVTPEQLEAERLQAEHGGTLGAAATFGESALNALTFGGAGAVARQISPEYTDEMLARRAANPKSDVAGDVVGTAGSLLLPGVGELGNGIRAGRLAGAVVKGAGTGAKIGSAALRLGTENAVASAIRAAADDLTRDNALDAEHILLSGGMGLALGGAGGAASEALPAFAKAAAKQVGGLLDLRSPGEMATKAVIGRTNKGAVKLAGRLKGGADGVGQTLLEEGVVTPLATKEAMLETAQLKAGEWGSRVGDAIQELDDVGLKPDTRAIAQNIREKVIAPLVESPSTRAQGEAVEARLKYLLDDLDDNGLVNGNTGASMTPTQFTDFTSLWKERQALDSQVGFESASMSGLKGHLADARRAFEEAVIQQADSAAGRKAIRPDWAADYALAKTKYSHLKFAATQLQEAQVAALANRAESLGDQLAGNALGIGSALADIAGGGSGIVGMGMKYVGGQLNKAIRNNANTVLATTLWKMQQHQGIGSGMIERVGAEAFDRMTGVASRVAAPRIGPWDDDRLNDTLAGAKTLTDPMSPASLALQATTDSLHNEGRPQLGLALRGVADASARFLAQKGDALAPRPNPDFPYATGNEPKWNPEAAQQMTHYAVAVQDPKAAIKRVSAGDATKEDVEVLQKLYPRVFDAVVKRIRDNLKASKVQPSYAELVRYGRMLGTPLTVDQQAPNLAKYAALAQKQAAATEASQAQQAAARSGGGGRSGGSQRGLASGADSLVKGQ